MKLLLLLLLLLGRAARGERAKTHRRGAVMLRLAGTRFRAGRRRSAVVGACLPNAQHRRFGFRPPATKHASVYESARHRLLRAKKSRSFLAAHRMWALCTRRKPALVQCPHLQAAKPSARRSVVFGPANTVGAALNTIDHQHVKAIGRVCAGRTNSIPQLSVSPSKTPPPSAALLLVAGSYRLARRRQLPTHQRRALLPADTSSVAVVPPRRIGCDCRKFLSDL